MMSSMEYWDSVYSAKKHYEVSWYEKRKTLSARIAEGMDLPGKPAVADIGCGQSYFVEDMLEQGTGTFYAVDASKRALDAVRERIGDGGGKVHYVNAELGEGDFLPESAILDLWHDRAAMHFLTCDNEVANYVRVLKKHLKIGGYAIIAEYSDKSPNVCSGLSVRNYTPSRLDSALGGGWEKIAQFHTEHPTPSGGTKHFIYTALKSIK